MNAVSTSILTMGIRPRFAPAIRASKPGGSNVRAINLVDLIQELLTSCLEWEQQDLEDQDPALAS